MNDAPDVRSITIREMLPSDWQRVSKIYAEALAEGWSTFNTVCPTKAEWNAAHLKDCRYVILQDTKVIGWCSLAPTSSREPYRGVAEVSIYVDKEYRNMGVGTKLLTHLCAESEKKGYWTLYAAVLEGNEVSMALHKKCGFREVGYREKIARDRFGNWRNTTIFEKRSRVIV